MMSLSTTYQYACRVASQGQTAARRSDVDPLVVHRYRAASEAEYPLEPSWDSWKKKHVPKHGKHEKDKRLIHLNVSHMNVTNAFRSHHEKHLNY